MNILVTGGSGLLGSTLIKLLKKEDGDGNMFPRVIVESPSHKDLDITKPVGKFKYDLIVHCAAYTNVDLAETERRESFDANVNGIFNLLENNSHIPFIFISSEFAAQPVNFYSHTKLIGEKVVEAMADNFLIIRTLFKPRPFTHPKAFIDQYTQGDYLDVIAPKLVYEILSWNRNSKMIYVGTGRKTMFELAKQTKPDVLPMSVKDLKVKRPTDYL